MWLKVSIPSSAVRLIENARKITYSYFVSFILFEKHHLWLKSKSISLKQFKAFQQVLLTKASDHSRYLVEIESKDQSYKMSKIK